jgi:hypothetical protein
MRERDGAADASRGRHRPAPFLVGLGLAVATAVAACSGAAAPSIAPSVAPSRGPSAVPSVAPSVVASAPAPSTAAATPAASTPVLDPERCPPTLPPADDETADGTDLEGDAAFIAHVKAALALLESKAPEAYAEVVTNVTRVRSVESFSGMCYDTGTYRVGDDTAYAPGYPVEQQVVWLAGTIVHDGCHRDRYVAGIEPSGRDAELACLQLQHAALKQIDEAGRFRDYVRDLIEGVDDPSNQYWNDPNRHW